METLFEKSYRKIEQTQIDFVRSLMNDIQLIVRFENKIPLWLFGFLY